MRTMSSSVKPFRSLANKFKDLAFRQGFVEGFTGSGLFLSTDSQPSTAVVRIQKGRSNYLKRLHAGAKDRKRKA